MPAWPHAGLTLKRLITLCYREAMVRWIVALALAGTLATAVYAQPIRMLPANGKLGELVGQQQAFPVVQIGGKLLRLTAGALIYDQNNRTIVHGVLPERASVLYVEEASGEISRIYILRPEELELVKRAQAR